MRGRIRLTWTLRPRPGFGWTGSIGWPGAPSEPGQVRKSLRSAWNARSRFIRGTVEPGRPLKVARSSRVGWGMASELKQSTAGELPVELSSFVGRRRELADVKRLLPSVHVITLTGPGGIGKSRLALRAARSLGRHFPDGAWWVELAELEDPDLLAYALARSMRVQERRDGAIDEALTSHMREQRLLLVLDNCEHLLDACR